MKRVIVVMPAGQQEGGAERMLLNLGKGLSRRTAVEHEYLFLREGNLADRARALGLNSRIIDVGRLSRPAVGLRGIRELANHLANSGADLVLDWMVKARLYSGLVSWRRGLQSGVWIHDFVGSGWMESTARMVPVNIVFASSLALATATVWHGQRPAVVQPGVDLDTFCPEPRSRQMVLERLGLAGDVFLLGCVGRLVRWKGFEVAISALRNLPDHCHLVVVGGPHFGEPNYSARLRQMTTELGLESRIHLVGQQDDVSTWLQAFDALVHITLRRNPADQVVKEAMACGTPVIAADSGYIREVIDHGQNGLLVMPNASCAADAVRLIMRDDKLRLRLGHLGRQTVATQFSIDTMVDAFLDVIL